jgi:hypothetical protein
VGFKLRREVRDAIPAGVLTKAERNLLLEVADLVNDDTREGWPGMAELTRAVGTGPEGVTKCLQRLAAKGVELRVAIGEDKARKPFFAHRGRRTTYRVPKVLTFKRKGGQSGDPSRDAKGGQSVQASGPERVDSPSEKGWTDSRTKGGQPVRQRVDRLSTPFPQSFSSKKPQSPPQPATPAEMLAAHDVPEGEREDLISIIEGQNNIKSFGWWINAHRNGTLAQAITGAREPRPADGRSRSPVVGWTNYPDQSVYDKPLFRTEPHKPYRDDPTVDCYAEL